MFAKWRSGSCVEAGVIDQSCRCQVAENCWRSLTLFGAVAGRRKQFAAAPLTQEDSQVCTNKKSMADDQSALIEGALRYGSPSGGAARYGIETRPAQPAYYHTESAIDPTQRAFDTSTTGNSVRRIPYTGAAPIFDNQQTAGSGKETNDAAARRRYRKKIGFAVAAVIVVVLLGAVLYFALARDEPLSASRSQQQPAPPMFAGANVGFNPTTGAGADAGSHEFAALQAPMTIPPSVDELGGVAIDTDVPTTASQDATTTYYYPSPMATPRSTPTPVPLPTVEEYDSYRPVAVPRGSADDGKPPPASWFGADAPTRGEAASEMALDGEFGNQAAVSKIYGGNVNSVLGGKNRPPFATVNEDAARQIGWAEIADPEAREAVIDANQIASGSARSMSELYQSNMDGRQFRQGSSASTLITPDQAAQAAIGNSPDRSEQFEAGRQRAKAITAESSAAIGSIYDKKRKAAAGLSAAAVAQQRQMNDTNFDYYDVQSQRPI